MTIDTSQVPIMPTTPQAGVHTTPAVTRTPKQEMDGEMFLNLLVTQLKYQDPSSPMDTTEMMAQTTQLASMEQLTALTKVNQESFALQMRVASAALIGQDVTFTNSHGDTTTGRVDSIRYDGEVPTVIIGDEHVPLNSIAGITAVTPGTTPDSDTDSDTTPDSSTPNQTTQA